MRTIIDHTPRRTAIFACVTAAVFLLPLFVDASHAQRSRDNNRGQSRASDSSRQVQRAAPQARAPQRQAAPAPTRAPQRQAAPAPTRAPQGQAAPTPSRVQQRVTPQRATPRITIPQRQQRSANESRPGIRIGTPSRSTEAPARSIPRLQLPAPRTQSDRSAAQQTRDIQSRWGSSERSAQASPDRGRPALPERNDRFTRDRSQRVVQPSETTPSAEPQNRPALPERNSRITRDRGERTAPERSERTLPNRAERSESNNRFNRGRDAERMPSRSTQSPRSDATESPRGTAAWRSSTRSERGNAIGDEQNRTRPFTSDRTPSRNNIDGDRTAPRRQSIEQRRNRAVESRTPRQSTRAPLTQYSHPSRNTRNTRNVMNITNVKNITNVSNVSSHWSHRPSRIIHRPIYTTGFGYHKYSGYGYHANPNTSLFFSISSGGFGFSFGHSWGYHHHYKPRPIFCRTSFRFIWTSSPYWYPSSYCGWPLSCYPYYSSYTYPTTHVVYRPVTTTIVVPQSETKIVPQNICAFTHREAWELLAQDQLNNVIAAFECLAKEHPYDGITHVGWSIAAALAGNPDQAAAIMRHAARTEVDALRHVPADSRLDEIIIHLIGAYAERIHEPGMAVDSLFMVAALRTALHDASSAHFAIGEAIRHGDTDESAYHLRDLLTKMMHEELFSRRQ